MSAFERIETPDTTVDGPVVRYKLAGHGLNGPQISASRHGVGIGGWWPTINRRETLEALIAQIEAAWGDYERLGKKHT